jgi:hypothetical protein
MGQRSVHHVRGLRGGLRVTTVRPTHGQR